MKRLLFFALLAVFTLPALARAEDQVRVFENFSGQELVSGLDFPWAMVWGPDDYLWVTERAGKRITRVNPETGETKVAVTIDDAFVGPQHEGLLGLALSPDLLEDGSANYVYVLYTHKQKQGDAENEYLKIARYEYDPAEETLGNPVTLLDGIPAGNDHNGGRLIFGPDGKLYFTHGELGHNQGGNYCLPIEAQRLPTQAEIDAKDYSAYLGKTFRMNPDGSIPEDNPVLDGVRSHIFTYGHRNPQGLVFVDEILFSSEQGPSTDDEINILKSGGNYGWPHVAGFQDDQAYVYANYSAAKNCEDIAFDANYIPAGVPVQKESDWHADNFVEPVKTLFTVPNGYNFADELCSEMYYICWPTVAPAAVAYYPDDGPIEAWRNSLLIATLKSGSIYRLPLTADKQSVQGDIIKYFTSQNRYRDVVVSPDGKSIYVATDKGGHVRGLDGVPAEEMENPGAILVFTYDE